MERLTRRELWRGSQGKTDKAVNYKVDEERRCVTHEGSTDFLIADRLAEYEDLEEQGKLLKLPCAVGDMVYVLRIDNTEYMMNNKKVWEIVEEKFEIRHFENISKTVFLTKSAAEQALKEMEGKK